MDYDNNITVNVFDSLVDAALATFGLTAKYDEAGKPEVFLTEDGWPTAVCLEPVRPNVLRLDCQGREAYFLESAGLFAALPNPVFLGGALVYSPVTQ